MKTLKHTFIFFLASLLAAPSMAQFVVDGQLVQRGEYRHGFGKLIGENEESAMFIGQRARLNANYKTEKFNFFVSIQDVRIWGSTPQVKATDPYLSVYEAWAETKFGNYFTLKLGRQELSYDNFRFLGNLDWALQGRSHDFALAKFEKEEMKLHFGAGYNQDAEKLSGNLFTIPNQYKAAQFVRYENALGNLQYSVLFWNNGVQFSQLDPVTNEVVKKELYYRQTIGVPTLKYQFGNTTLSAFYYHQLGKDGIGRNVRAFDASAQVSQAIDVDVEKGTKLRLTAGMELISGTANQTAGKNKSFSPLYGTNHMHNGYMDLFFVGGRFENAGGLQDIFVRTRFDFNQEFWASVNAHSFGTQASTAQNNQELSKNLGVEIDLTLGYLINDAVSLQSGYSQLFASDTYEALQSIQNPASRQNWAYIMMIYRPTMKNKFIGLLF